MSELIQDLRHCLRMLRKAPGFTAVVLLTLSLGIGVNTLIFSAVNAILLRPLPYPDSERLVSVPSTQPSRGIDRMTVSLPDYRDWKEQSRSFEAWAALMRDSFVLTGAGEPRQLRGVRVSAAFFNLLGIRPALGRGFLSEEEQPGHHRVAVLSHALWQQQLGSDPALVGRSITMNGASFTVVGIAPAGFQYPDSKIEVWVPLAFSPGSGDRESRFLRVIGRLKSGVTPARARLEMEGIARRLEQTYAENKGVGVLIIPFRSDLVGDLSASLWMLQGAVAFVLLIACANVANLLLARSASRRKEIALRSALGAGQKRLVRQLLTESLLLAVAGGTLGTLLAAWGLNLVQALVPEDLPRVDQIALDGRVLAFTVGISLLTGVLFGLLPARRATRVDLVDPLKEGGRQMHAGRRNRRTLKLLVVSEVALSLVLMVGAGLLTNSLLRLRAVKPGFDPENLLTVQLSLPASKYPDAAKRGEFFRQALSGIGSMPGVLHAGATNDLPLGGTGFNRYYQMTEAEGRKSATRPEQEPPVAVFEVTPGYFRAMGMPLLKGRPFGEQDDAGTPAVAIVNEAYLKRYLPEGEPLGRRIRLGSPESWNPWMTVVGVAGEATLERLGQFPFPMVYTPHLQGTAIGTTSTMILAVRTDGDSPGLAAAIRAQVHRIDPDQPLGEFRTMSSLVSRSLVEPRFQTVLLALFACLALVLAAIGIYGVIGYSVKARTCEIGIRVALGARPRDVLKMILREGAVLIVVGVGAGAAGALGVARLLSKFLFGVSATDPLTFVMVSLLLAGVGLLACYLPARRASQVDPMVALRFE
ncbi:MAG: ABC transporter permease [Acidobacteria bacterium]|nr:ABC transporter permease [Acidobacteriota bacterium]